MKQVTADNRSVTDAAKQLTSSLEAAKADLTRRSVELNEANQKLATAKKDHANKATEAAWLKFEAARLKKEADEERKRAPANTAAIQNLDQAAESASTKAQAIEFQTEQLAAQVSTLESSASALQEQVLQQTIDSSDEVTKQTDALSASAAATPMLDSVLTGIVAVFMVGLLGVVVLLARDGIRANRAERDRKSKNEPAIATSKAILSTEYESYLGAPRLLEIPHVRAVEEWVRHAALSKTVRKLIWVAVAAAFLECVGFGVALTYHAFRTGLSQPSLELLQKSLLWTLLGAALGPIGALLVAYNMLQNKALAAMKFVRELGLISGAATAAALSAPATEEPGEDEA